MTVSDFFILLTFFKFPGFDKKENYSVNNDKFFLLPIFYCVYICFYVLLLSYCIIEKWKLFSPFISSFSPLAAKKMRYFHIDNRNDVGGT